MKHNLHYSVLAVILLSFVLMTELHAMQKTENFESKSLAGSPEYLDIARAKAAQERTAMYILLGWGGLNVVAGGAFSLNSGYRDFGMMTAGWGLVNAAIAGFALYGGSGVSPDLSYSEALQDEMFFNRILAINSGLNAGYIATGFAMNYLGSSTRVKQFGSAVMIQGAFLLGFDAWLLWNSTDRLRQLSVWPDSQALITPEGAVQVVQGFTMSIQF